MSLSSFYRMRRTMNLALCFVKTEKFGDKATMTACLFASFAHLYITSDEQSIERS